MKKLVQVANEQYAARLQSIYGAFSNEAELKMAKAQHAEGKRLIRGLLTGELQETGYAPPSLTEAVHTTDFKILFPSVVEDILRKPREGQYLGQTLLARTINIDGPSVMFFPTLGSIQAFELGETQEPPEQDPSFKMHSTELRALRYGLKLEVANDVIKYSAWDILGLYITEAGNALRRLKERLIFEEYDRRAYTQFDNSLADATKHTTGKNASNAKNGTFSHMDLLDMMAALAANGYTPDTVLMPPLGWSIWAKDPFLRYQILHQGTVGQNIGQFSGTDATMNANSYVPFGLLPVVSPFQTTSLNSTLSTGVTGMSAGNHISISVMDRQQSMLIMQQEPIRMVSFENVMRDIQNLMFQEKYGLALLNGGRSVVRAKNVRADMNYEPLYTTRSITVS